MKKITKKLFLVIISAILTVSAVGCSNGVPKGFVRVDFLYGGDFGSSTVYSGLINKYNETQGQIDKIFIKATPAPESGYSVMLNQKMSSSKGHDIATVPDDGFKQYAKYFDDMTNKLPAELIDDMYPTQTYRYHYNIETTTYNNDDPLYGVPLFNDATILYYNKTALQANGVKCISVNAEDLDAWNKNEIADKNGKKKSDYGITIDVPEKGYFRSINPFVPEEGVINASNWTKLSSNEIAVFNDAIAMNWDEIEDAGLLCTLERNSESKADTKYGFYTEWWFNYGWSVGGDCLEDMTGNGDWTFSLAADYPNYIVADGKTYVGTYTGKTYKAGQTLDLPDTLDAAKGVAIEVATDDATYYNYTVNKKRVETNPTAAAAVEEGTLKQLPSIKNAFERFCYLAGNSRNGSGTKVCPPTSAFSGGTAVQYFSNGLLCFLIEQINNVDYIGKNMKDKAEWGIAPIPVYKTYANPTDPYCDEIDVQGLTASHSFGNAICIRKGSAVKDECYKVIKWMISEGQHWLAETGRPSSRISDKSIMTTNFKYGNPDVLADALESSLAGDWWYMPDSTWIDVWAEPLNGQVRQGRVCFEDYIYRYVTTSNNALARYKK